ncbi:MAG: bifunctional 3-hydroxydecanoyl-ACP dehydratase/trans-2-decenoyl-ACP isomerase [Elusimicrobia bacterium]|nr:bifunctional 3-hydroxydecanoyl-ACP dehydratase/trans-2-decenoyl-ACP isomerase [Elusimicrobiota bacterium]
MRFDEFQKKSRFSPDEILDFVSGLDGAPAGLPALPWSLLLPFHEIREISWDQASGKGRIVAVRRNRLDDWFYDCHFQGDPVMPGCWGVDAVWQALKFFAAWRGLTGCDKTLGMEGVSFFGQIRPYDKEVVYAVDVVSVEKDGDETMLTGKAAVSVDGVQVYTIASASVATAYWTEETPSRQTPAASMPDEPARRLSWAEFTAKTRLSRAEVIGLSRGTMLDAPGLEVGLLPTGPMLEIGRVEKLAWDEALGEGELRASRENGPHEWFYAIGPTKPTVLSIDAVWQLCGLFLVWRGNQGIGRALGFEKVEVFDEIRPSDRDIRYEARIIRHTKVPTGDAFVRADTKVYADGRLILACTNANVGCHKNIRYSDYPLPSAMSTGGKLKVAA